MDVYQGSQGLPTSDFTARVNYVQYRKWQNLRLRRCPFTFYVKHDDCGRPDDPRSWIYKKLYLDTRFTDFTDAADGTLQGDDQAPVELTGSITSLAEYILYPISFEEVADAAILADVTLGRWINAQLKASFCFIPPESLPAFLSLNGSICE